MLLMTVEIWLPHSRVAASGQLWPGRLPIDDLDEAVRLAPERPAFVGRNSMLGAEIRLSYGELGERVDMIAQGLCELGIGKGDVVAFQLPNWWEFIALLYACSRIGAVANPLMPIFRQRELRFMDENVGGGVEIGVEIRRRRASKGKESGTLPRPGWLRVLGSRRVGLAARP